MPVVNILVTVQGDTDDIPATRWAHGGSKAIGNGACIPDREIACEGVLRDPLELAMVEARQFGVLRRLLTVRDSEGTRGVRRLLYEELRQLNHIRVVIKRFG